MRRVGLDLALSAPHQAVVCDDAATVGKPFKVRPTRDALDELERRATAGASGTVEFIMEPTGLAYLPMAAELARRGHTVYVAKPQKAHLVRKMLAPYAKTDGFDARALAQVRHIDPKGVHPLRVPTAAETTLRVCAKQRARLVVDAARAKGRIRSWLVLVHPHLGQALGEDGFTQATTAFLRRYLDPFVVRAKGKGWLRELWRRNGGDAEGKQVEAIWAATESTCELFGELRAKGQMPFDYAIQQQLIASELQRIEDLENEVQKLDAIIAVAYRAVDPERVLEREVPGVAATIAPTIEAFVGDVERFGSAKRFAAFFGLVPRTNQTGGRESKPGQRLTKGGQPLLKKYAYLAAETARRHDPELALVYETVLARGKHHYAAVIAVAHKLVRRIFGLLKLRAAARRAHAEGRTLPRVTWRYTNPHTGELLSADEARAWIAVHCPSKAEKQRRRHKPGKVAAAAPHTSSVAQTGSVAQEGSSPVGNVTNEDRGGPPVSLVASLAACGKPEDNTVINSSISQANVSLDVT